PKADPLWNGAAICVLGAILLGALAALVGRIRTVPRGPERGALRLLLFGSGIAVVMGMSDFVPRNGAPVPRAGPVAILLLLTIVCALVVRDHFLDVDRFLARALGILLGSTVGTVLFVFVADVPRHKVVPLWAATVLVLAAGGPVGRA